MEMLPISRAAADRMVPEVKMVGKERSALPRCFLMGHRGLQLLVVAGNDDGVVDVRAHLNGLHDEVAKEIQR